MSGRPDRGASRVELHGVGTPHVVLDAEVDSDHAVGAVTLGFGLIGAAAAQSNSPTTIVPTTIVTGGAYQQILPAQRRLSLTIENNNATDNCNVQIMATGVTNAGAGTSILLLPGGSYARYYPYVPNEAIQATCANSSDTLYVDHQ